MSDLDELLREAMESLLRQKRYNDAPLMLVELEALTPEKINGLRAWLLRIVEQRGLPRTSNFDVRWTG